MLNVYDLVCHKMTGALGEILAAAQTQGRWRGQVKIRYQRDGRVFYVAPEYLTTDVSRSAEIIKAGKKKNSPSLEVNDDE